MVYTSNKPRRFLRFDTVIFAVAIVVLVIALVFHPKDAFHLIRRELVFSPNWTVLAKSGELEKLVNEFNEENTDLTLKLGDDKADIISFDLPSSVPVKTEERLRLASFIMPLFYNIDLLERCGFDRPPKTGEDFIAYAKKASALAGGGGGIAFSGNIFQDFTPWFWAAGLKPETPGTAPDWSSRTAVDVFGFFKRLYDEGLVDNHVFDQTPEKALENFISGKCAFFIGSSANIAVIREKAPTLAFNVTTIPQPANRAVKSTFNLTSWNVAIAGESENSEAARRFIGFLETRLAGIAAASDALQPENAAPRAPSSDALMQKVRNLAEGSDLVWDSDYLGDLSAFSALFQTQLVKMWHGGQTPKEAVQAMRNAP